MGLRASITRTDVKNKLPICLDCGENSRVHSQYVGCQRSSIRKAYLCPIKTEDHNPLTEHGKPPRPTLHGYLRNVFLICESQNQKGNNVGKENPWVVAIRGCVWFQCDESGESFDVNRGVFLFWYSGLECQKKGLLSLISPVLFVHCRKAKQLKETLMQRKTLHLNQSAGYTLKLYDPPSSVRNQYCGAYLYLQDIHSFYCNAAAYLQTNSSGESLSAQFQ